jgi:2,4-dienoyl-CoA reductase-like NADH-dependent reductase (Old Yellow Enzyme family)
MAADIRPLFESFTLGPLTLSNRIVMAPMTRNFSPGGVPNDQVVAYYKRRAESGVGLIITEGTTVGHKTANGYPAVPAIHGDEALAGWKKVVDAVHAVGGKIAPQLWHVGNVRRLGTEPDGEVFLAFEVVVERPFGHACSLGDLLYPSAVITLAQHHLGAGGKDTSAFVLNAVHARTIRPVIYV